MTDVKSSLINHDYLNSIESSGYVLTNGTSRVISTDNTLSNYDLYRSYETNVKENNKVDNLFGNGMFDIPKVSVSLKLSITGNIGIKTQSGKYRYYKNGKVYDITNMSFDIPESLSKMCFVVPSTKLKDGDLVYIKDSFYHYDGSKGSFISLETGCSKIVHPVVNEMFDKEIYYKLVMPFKRINGKKSFSKIMMMSSMLGNSNGDGNAMAYLLMSQMMGDSDDLFESFENLEFDIDEEVASENN